MEHRVLNLYSTFRKLFLNSRSALFPSNVLLLLTRRHTILDYKSKNKGNV
jgi:hypothetical protein